MCYCHVGRTPEDHRVTESVNPVSNGRPAVPRATRKRHLGLVRIPVTQSLLTNSARGASLAGQLPLAMMMGQIPPLDNPSSARDHLANERTFLAWLRTGVAVVVFGFAIGRFAIAIQEFMKVEGHPQNAARMSVWFGLVAIVTGVALVFAGLTRYRRTRAQLEVGIFEPAGFLIDVVAGLTVVFGLALAAYLVYIQALH